MYSMLATIICNCETIDYCNLSRMDLDSNGYEVINSLKTMNWTILFFIPFLHIDLYFLIFFFLHFCLLMLLYPVCPIAAVAVKFHNEIGQKVCFFSFISPRRFQASTAWFVCSIVWVENFHRMICGGRYKFLIQFCDKQ